MVNPLRPLKALLHYGKMVRSSADLAKLSRNTIRSRHVSLAAIEGPEVEVMGGSHVDARCRIGGYTFIGYNCFVTAAQIGRYCSIANNVSIGMGEHKLDRISTNSIFYDNVYERLTEKECIVGSDVWIGVDSIIRRGVRVGHGAVVGANSLVTRDVPDFAIVVGSPARVLKYRFPAEVAAAILESRWWEKDKEGARAAFEKLEPLLHRS